MPRHAIAILFLGLTSTVAAQSDNLKPLDQTVEDVSPLSRSLRQVELGLRTPTDFEQVYRLPGHEDLYMRISGGIYALFPQSAYSQGKNGPIPLIPAGTVYHIGYPIMDHLGLADASTHHDEGRVGEDPYGRLNLRLDPQRSGPTRQRQALSSAATVPFTGVDRRQPREGSPIVDHSSASTIVTDARYRANRVRELMQSAANAVRVRTLSTNSSAN